MRLYNNKDSSLPPLMYKSDFTLKNNRFSHHGTSWISQKPIIIQEIESNKKQVKSLTDFKTKPFKVTSLTDNIEIKIDNEIIGTLPIRLQEIQKSIEDSYYILELEDDWDDEGGVPVDKNTFIRGIRFLINYSVWLLHNQNFLLAPPQINPGPDGSIDILWRTNHYRMLLNVPKDAAKDVAFYGDNKRKSNSIKSNVPSEGVQEFLALWLKNLKV